MRLHALVLLACLTSCSKCSTETAPPAAATPAPVASADRPNAGEGGGRHQHEDRNEPAVAEPALHLDVMVDGAATTWQPAQFASVPHFQSDNRDGESRDTWSLRDLAHHLAGEKARVTAVIGDTTEALDAQAWNDASRTPILHTTRRGSFKFRWAEKDGKWDDDVTVRDVARLEIATQKP